ncbi:MAG: hypothetical protein LBS54_00865, partial [Dysgonamonadaceae bacterium]|nr:hypothetical protein [Dysgonamonadaceae bacterium]
MKQLFLRYKNDKWFWPFLGIAIVALIAILLMSRDAGTSGDEFFHNKHAKDVYNWYASAGKDTTAVTVTEQNNLPTYGQVVDNLAYVIYHWTGVDSEMSIRHLVCSFFGWLAMLFAALIGFRLTKKWRPAVIILILMFLSPRFLGHSFNNLKDLPFATAMIMGLYYIIAFLQDFPKVKKSTMVMLAVSIGFAIAVRIGGLLLIAFFGLFAAIMFISRYKFSSIWSKPNNKLFGKLFLWGLIIVIGGYILALLLWPYALNKPIENPKFVLSYMSQFATAIRQLFEGSFQWSDMLPWYYTPKFILMTIPVAVIIGFLLYPFVGGWKKENRLETFMLYFAFIFPVFWIVYSNANVYGGWRHAMFAYPPMVVAAGLGFSALADFIQLRITNY